ncbi:MAG TPA: PDZ domain-containing protein [Woeseiaceae bacterium]|nr:PDZ domain-containing protein [Woeseiaceae bacterium]
MQSRYRIQLFTMALILVTTTVPAAAQDAEADAESRARAAAQSAERSQTRAENIEVQLREAEERLAEAAAHVAELSRSRLPDMSVIERRIRGLNRPVFGVTIGPGENEGPVEGVTILAVTPGSAAAEAGLRAGDVLTAIDDESLGAGTEAEANDKLLDFMAGVEEGDKLNVQYLRDGDSRTVEVEPQPGHGFAWAWRNRDWPMPVAPLAPGARVFSLNLGGNWGDMEMVSLTEDLGRYFGTDSGLLVVRAPEDESLKLRDGDVIQSIDGREPTSVSHAMRILGSYAGGETLQIQIMRDRKRETLSIEVPDRRQGRLHLEFATPEFDSHLRPAPAPAARPVVPPEPAERI